MPYKSAQQEGRQVKITEVKTILDAEILAGESILDTEVYSACGSDLMSDVLAFVKDQALLLTGLMNPQVIRTAEMMDIKAIVFVRGKRPEESVIEMAEERGVILMTTEQPLYTACGLLYSSGLAGRSKEAK